MNSLSAASDGHPSPEAHPSDGKSTLPTYQKPDPPNKRASGPTPTQSRSDSSSPPQIDYGRKRASLPRQVKFYLNVHQRSLSYHHYSFKSDARNFLKTTFLEIAVDYEPLLYAVVAFAAYNYALDRPEGRARHFLDYYDRSVSLFRRSLAKSDRPTLATLLTMLQLATIEVSLLIGTFFIAGVSTRLMTDRSSWATGSTSSATRRPPTRSSPSSTIPRRSCKAKPNAKSSIGTSTSTSPPA